MLLITSVIAAALTLIFIKLSFNVIALRRKNKVSLGSGGHEDLEEQFEPKLTSPNMFPLGSYYLPAWSLMEPHGGWFLFQELPLLLAA